MFVQLCLLAAALHVGRNLFKNPQHEEPAEPLLPQAPHDDEEAEVGEQFNMALLSTGLSGAATIFFPSLRVLGGAVVLYGGIPIAVRAKELLVDEHRVGAEVLDTVGMVAVLATKHFTSASLTFLLYAGGRKMRLMTERATQESLTEAFARRAHMVWVLCAARSTRASSSRMGARCKPCPRWTSSSSTKRAHSPRTI